jgi:hypothetical protein
MLEAETCDVRAKTPYQYRKMTKVQSYRYEVDLHGKNSARIPFADTPTTLCVCSQYYKHVEVSRIALHQMSDSGHDVFSAAKVVLGEICDRLRSNDSTLRILDLSILPARDLAMLVQSYRDVPPEARPAWYAKLDLCTALRGNTMIQSILCLNLHLFLPWCAYSSLRMQQFLEENSSMRELHLVGCGLGYPLDMLRAVNFERILRAVGRSPHLQVLSLSGTISMHADAIESLLNSASIRTLRIILNYFTLQHQSMPDQLANAFAANRTIENLEMNRGPIRALASIPCLRQLTLAHALKRSDLDDLIYLLINSGSLNELKIKSMYVQALLGNFFLEYSVNAPLIRLAVLRCNHMLSSDMAGLAECLEKAVHLRELHITYFYFNGDTTFWVEAMRRNASLHRVSLPDSAFSSSRTRGRMLVEAYCLRNRMLPILISSLHDHATDETENVDSYMIPSVLACARALSRTGKSMMFLVLLSMGESIELTNARKRCRKHDI